MPTADEEDELTPQRIRMMREKLDLSQVRAGEVIGGGPRAFAKYESGKAVPTAAIANLLRVLSANPKMLRSLGVEPPAGAPVAEVATAPTPFEVTSRHVAELRPDQASDLVRRLITAEVRAEGIAPDTVHVASNLTAPDGGEDASVEWSAGPDSTPYLRARANSFQIKTGKFALTAAGREMVDKKGNVKPAIRSVLSRGGAYTLLCFEPYTHVDLEKRITRMAAALQEAGLVFDPAQLAMRDADQIAAWVNHRPAVAAWVLEQYEPSKLRVFRSWSHWAGRVEHASSPWVDDARLAEVADKVRETASQARAVRRVVGPSGVGKSRLVLEGLGPRANRGGVDEELSDLVLYVSEDESDSALIRSTIQSLVDSAARAVVVVDRCTEDTHRIAAGMVQRSVSRLSLITVDDEVPSGRDDPETLKVQRASDSVPEGILGRAITNLPADDLRRLVTFSKGFTSIAVRLGRDWNSLPLARLNEDTLVDRFVVGRAIDENLLKKAAQVIAVFGAVGASAPADQELESITALTSGVSVQDMRAAIQHFLNRGLLQTRGRFVLVQPPPIALRLAERQWNVWSDGEQEAVLTSDAHPALAIRAAKQLSLLNTTSTAQKIVRHVCRRGGKLERELLQRPQMAEVVSRLAEVDALAVVEMLDRVLGSTNDLEQISGDTRRHIVWALEKIAFAKGTFEAGALLLLRLAVRENETWGNNATGQFKALFPVLLGDTEADGKMRLDVLEQAAKTNDPAQLKIVREALFTGSRVDHFSRGVGSELHGSRPALEPWRPDTWNELWEYVETCARRLADLGTLNTELGAGARADLGRELRSYVSRGLLDTVSELIDIVTQAVGPYWPEALESLGHVLQYDGDGMKAADVKKVKALIAKLTPNTLEDRVRFIVSEMPWDYPADSKIDYDDRGELQRKAVFDVAKDVLGQPGLLGRLLSGLSAGSHRMTSVFGEAIGEHDATPQKTLRAVAGAVADVEPDNRNYDLLAGFLVGLAKKHRADALAFKREAATSSAFAPALPLICWRLGIEDEDVGLVVSALRSGILSPRDVRVWAYGGQLAHLKPAVVAPLFDFLMDHSQRAFWVAQDVMGMYLHGRAALAAELKPQMVHAAAAAVKWTVNEHDDDGKRNNVETHHFETLMERVLKWNATDETARAVAKHLADGVVQSAEDIGERLFQPLLPILLHKFAGDVWPVIGAAIAGSSRERRWRYQYLLGNSFSRGPTALQALPEQILFDWLKAYPSTAPAFAAIVLPILRPKVQSNAEATPEPGRRRKPKSEEYEEFVEEGGRLNPLITRLLDEFGDREDVTNGLTSNLHTYGWSGSVTTYYAMYREPLRPLLQHRTPNVRKWARRTLDEIERDIDAARTHDEEWEAGLDT
jgi:hypothetical protein